MVGMAEHDAQETQTEQPQAGTAVEPTEPRKPRWKRWLWRSAQVFLGLIVGLVIAEVIFWYRDDGAFPHVNVYVPDDELGVRLEPGASQRFQLRDNPISSIRINSSGYRGANFPAVDDASEEILVVGDSQVFGLGVEEDETFSAQLAALTGRTVINGGVPTYGPTEYTAVARELTGKRKTKTVIYVVNFVNDLFESNRPNRDRHAVWDGWAVRKETAPKSVTQFPGRKWLYSKSHAFYAFRRWMYSDDEKLDPRGFESEGTWQDLVDQGEETGNAKVAAAREVAERNQKRSDAYNEATKEMYKATAEAEEATMEAVPELEDSWDNPERNKYLAAAGSPGDIVGEEAAEEGRSIVATAKLIRQGLRYRAKLERKLAKRPGRNKKVLAAIEARKQLEKKSVELYSYDLDTAFVPSTLEPRLREIKEVCDQAGASLVVVALPIDVQVSSEEWKKYGVEEPIDMEPSRVLLSDLVQTAEHMGVRAIDLTPALAGVQGQAFLDHDIHMTALGHKAVAEAIAGKLKEAAPIRRPDLTLPAGRTRPPPKHAWKTTLGIPVARSTPAFCETKIINEWFLVSCLPKGKKHIPSGIEVKSGGRGEALSVVTDSAANLVTPIFRGEDFKAVFHWTKHSRELVVSWPQDSEKPKIEFGEKFGDGQPLEVDPVADALCRCYNKVHRDRECPLDEYDGIAYDDSYYGKSCQNTCASLYTGAAKECLATYGDVCEPLIACVGGHPSALPRCPAGQANAGATGQCFALCSDEVPCETGTCTPWQGSHVCK